MNFVLAAAAAIAASALASCAGSTSPVPAQLSAGALTGAAVPDNACNIAGTWYFHGSCIEGKLAPKGGSFSLPAYRGISLQAKLGRNNAPGKVAFVLGDATGKGDITGTRRGQPFKPYAKVCVGQSGTHISCPGKPFVYLELVNNSGSALFLSGSATIAVTNANGLPGKNGCLPATLTPNGWFPDSVAAVTPSGNSFTIVIPGGSGFRIPAGALYIALACR